jgi:hypothetical protein
VSDLHKQRPNLNVITATNAQPQAIQDVPSPVMPMTDENGDSIFRFRIPASDRAISPALNELYRAQIYDLLKIVRLYSKGRPVLVDSFAFRNQPDHVQPLQPRTGFSESNKV